MCKLRLSFLRLVLQGAFFLKAEDLIKIGDKKIAFCNQFISHNLPLKHFKALEFVIK